MKLGIIGASGRMGQAVINALQPRHGRLVAAIVSQQSGQLGQSIADTQYQALEEVTQSLDVLIDFSLPQALPQNIAFAVKNRTPIVVCTTGLEPQQQQLLNDAAETVPVLYARNTSVGIALLEQLVALSAAALTDADIEVFEAHHKNKKDAPSGTALALGEAAAKGRQQPFEQLNAGLRSAGEREPGSIGFSVMRAADIVGEHQVMLAQPGERLELTHRVADRKIFAEGALTAAKWLMEQPAGRYSMQDTLNLKETLGRILDAD